MNHRWSGGSAAILEGQHATLGAEGCEEIGGGKLGYERDSWAELRADWAMFAHSSVGCDVSGLFELCRLIVRCKY